MTEPQKAIFKGFGAHAADCGCDRCGAVNVDDALAALRYLKAYLDRLERQGQTWVDGDLLLAYQNLRAAVGIARGEPWPSNTASEARSGPEPTP